MDVSLVMSISGSNCILKYLIYQKKFMGRFVSSSYFSLCSRNSLVLYSNPLYIYIYV